MASVSSQHDFLYRENVNSKCWPSRGTFPRRYERVDRICSPDISPVVQRDAANPFTNRARGESIARALPRSNLNAITKCNRVETRRKVALNEAKRTANWTPDSFFPPSLFTVEIFGLRILRVDRWLILRQYVWKLWNNREWGREGTQRSLERLYCI